MKVTAQWYWQYCSGMFRSCLMRCQQRVCLLMHNMANIEENLNIVLLHQSYNQRYSCSSDRSSVASRSHFQQLKNCTCCNNYVNIKNPFLLWALSMMSQNFMMSVKYKKYSYFSLDKNCEHHTTTPVEYIILGYTYHKQNQTVGLLCEVLIKP